MKSSNKVLALAIIVLLLASIEANSADEEAPVKSSFSLMVDRFLSYFSGKPEEVKESPEVSADKISGSHKYYEDALLRLENDEIQAAVIQLRNALKSDPNNLSVYLLLAQIYLDHHRPWMVENIYHEALAKGIDKKLIVSYLAKAYLQQFKYQEILDNIPTTGLPKGLKAEMRVVRAQAFFGMSRYDKAESVLGDVLRILPSYPPAIIMMAKLNIARKNENGANQLLASISETGVYEPEYWLLKGEIARSANNLPDAIRHYTKAIDLENDHLVSLQARASLYIDYGKLDLAAEDVAVIRDTYPNDLRGLMLEALMHSKNGNNASHEVTLKAAYAQIENLNFLDLQDDGYNLLLVSTLYYFGELH